MTTKRKDTGDETLSVTSRAHAFCTPETGNCGAMDCPAPRVKRPGGIVRGLRLLRALLGVRKGPR